MNLPDTGHGPMAGACEYGSEVSGPIKGEGFSYCQE
jgi:hypothetical protein